MYMASLRRLISHICNLGLRDAVIQRAAAESARRDHATHYAHCILRSVPGPRSPPTMCATPHSRTTGSLQPTGATRHSTQHTAGSGCG
jgi:hypothetical protein